MKKILIKTILIYKKTISKIFSKMGCHCKYYPTCSEYTRQAIEKYGSIKGGYYGVKRIIRCNPFSKGGYDPLK
jgi:putative membrane protein insertion efficiency factor